jgi:hypothetical protein
MKPRVVNALLLLAALSSCGRKVNSSLRGEFKLLGTTSDTLPVLVERDSLCVHTLTSGAMRFSTDSTYTSNIRIRHECLRRKTEEENVGVLDGRYRVSGDSIFFFNDERKFTALTVRLNPDTLFIQGRLHTLVFVR